MQNTSFIEIQREAMNFSVGHFTIFGPTEREPLHGHNYQAYLGIESLKNSDGLCFDYRWYKKKMIEHCRALNQSLLLPTKSQYLTLQEDEKYIIANFNGERLPFLKSDVTLLPLANITVEELSRWFIEKLLEDGATLENHGVVAMTVKVFSGPGQSGSTTWQRKK